MRTVMLAALIAAAGLATPSVAKVKQAGSTPTFEDCFRLAWVRGVHVERGELPDWNAECMANKIPFNSGMAVDSVSRSSN
jgi:hypothetical protein